MKKIAIINLLIIFIIAFVCNTKNVFSQSNNQTSNYYYTTINDNQEHKFHKNLILIKAKKHLSIDKSGIQFQDAKEINNILNKINTVNIRVPFDYLNHAKYKDKDIFGLSKLYEIAFTNNINPIELAKEFEELNAEIEYSCPVYINNVASVYNDSLADKQWNLENIQSSLAHTISKGSKDIVVAIVDTEVDWEHEDLAANIWTNPNEIPDDGIDNDNNGKIDDWHGWDFLSNSNYYDIINNNIYEDNDTKIYDINTDKNHGTLVAGCAMSITNNLRGLASIGYNTSIMPIKIISDYGFGWRGHEGILYAAVMGADIINCSWTQVGYSKAEKEIVMQAHYLGAIVVVAAGNSANNIDNFQYINDLYQHVLYVGSNDANDKPSKFTSYGINTTVYSPGTDVYCCVPYNKYISSSGTSLSAPIACAVAGLIKSIHPDWSPRQIIQQIRSTSDNVLCKDSLEKQKFYYGRLNAYRALLYNQSFDSSPKIPGIESIKDTILTKSGGIESINTTILRLNIKNYLASANNVVVSLKSLDTLISITCDSMIINSLTTLEEKIFDFNIKISTEKYWYINQIPILITYKTDDYINYQLITLPLNIIPKSAVFSKLHFVDSVRTNIPDTLCKKTIVSYINSTNLDNLWGAGMIYLTNINDKVCPFVFNATKEKVDLVSIFEKNTYLDCFYGIDNNTAFVSLSDETYNFPKLYKTTDKGNSWKYIDIGVGINRITDIKFIDANNGVVLSMNNSADKNIIHVTNDGGNTWHHPNYMNNLEIDSDINFLFIGKLNKEYYILYFITGLVFISEDKGLTWKKYDYSYPDVYSKTVYCGKNNIGAFFRSDITNNNYFAFSSDCGYNWNKYPKSIYYNTAPNYLYSPESSNEFIAIYYPYEVIYSINNGMEWYPIYLDSAFYINQNTRSEEDILATGFTEGRKTRTWYYTDGLYYFDTDFAFYPINTSNEDLLFLNSYPNPATDNVICQFSVKYSAFVNISLVDITGKEIKYLVSRRYDSGCYHSIEWDCSDLANGIYFYKFVINNNIYSKKIVITR